MRIRIDLAYDGTDFRGWQSQPGGGTVQDLLEHSLREVLSAPGLRLVGQGRTDAGVHALRQVAHFDADTLIPPERLPRLLNKRLMQRGIVVLEARRVPNDFHARFSASSRTYCYVLYRSETPPPVYSLRYCHHVSHRFDAGLVKEAIGGFAGRHDFAALCSSDWEGDTTVRTMLEASLVIEGPWVHLIFKANAFLHNMVRHMVGLLLEVGKGRIAPAIVRSVVESPSSVDSSARPWNLPPARGLFLADVKYPEGP